MVKNLPTADAPHVLVIRRRYLGDIVLLGSVLRNLRLHWPKAQLTVLTEPAYTAVLALNPDVTTALSFPRTTPAWPAFLAALRRARFTHVLDFDNTEKTALLTRFTGALLRVCFDRELIKYRYPRLYTHSAKVTNAFYDTHHITDTYLELLRPLGERHTVLQTSLPCPCFPADQIPGLCTKGDSYKSYCVRQLTTDQVYAATRAALLRRP